MIELSKQRIKSISKLKLKKYRESEGLVLVEGFRTISQIIEDGVRVNEIICCQDECSNYESILSAVPVNNRFAIPNSYLKNLSTTPAPQKIFAVVPAETKTATKLNKLIYLDRIADPSNMGTIFRTASALGFDGVILSDGCCELFNPKTIRASVGKVFSMPVINEIELASYQGEIVIADIRGNIAVNELKVAKPYVLVLGSEAFGISKEIADLASKKVYIPMLNDLESLNVAAAASILMYQLTFYN